MLNDYRNFDYRFLLSLSFSFLKIDYCFQKMRDAIVLTGTYGDGMGKGEIT